MITLLYNNYNVVFLLQQEEGTMGTMFGEYFKKKRLGLGKTLRQFCLEHHLDPGNISKLERGILPPPASSAKLTYYANCLEIREGTDEWLEFFDIARAEAGRIPEEILTNKDLVAKLPLVFRTLKGQKLNKEQLEKLARELEKLNAAE
jgi:transcriptional regulator with XRE-family HTH domain